MRTVRPVSRIVAFDVETPNGKGDAIVSIGFVIADESGIRYEGGTLVQPETWFDPCNCSIHGILPRHVAQAPTFPEVWETLAPYFTDALLVAHNAPFDLGVLRQTLLRYRLPAPEWRYCCTVQMARRRFPKSQFGSYRLNDLALGFSIPLLHHHDAAEDAKACYLLYRTLLERYGEDARDERIYPPKTKKPTHVSHTRALSHRTETEAKLDALQNVLLTCNLSEPLPPHDSMALSHWVMRNESLLEEETFAPLRNLLYRLLHEDYLDEDEQAELHRILRSAPR